MLKYIVFLSNIKNITYNTFYRGYRNLEVDKENLNSFKLLSISDNSKHIKLNRIIDFPKSLSQLILFGVILGCIHDFEVSYDHYYLFALKVIFELILILICYRSFFNVLADFVVYKYFIQNLVPSFHITVLLFFETIILVGFLFALYTGFGWIDFLQFKQSFIPESMILQFYSVTIAIIFVQVGSLYFFIKKLTIFEKSSISYSVSVLTGCLTVTTYLVGMESDLSRVNLHAFILMQFLILVTILPFITGLVFRKNEELANSILKNQLLLPIADLDYDELVKGYSLGGEKIKEIIEKNEKFLKVVLWNEENPFYTWKTYDNYLEYKNYRYKQFQKK